jgi:hypothetical protein
MLLLCIALSSLAACGKDDGLPDASTPPDMATVDMTPVDPIVGKACGGSTGMFCPCGYFCPAGKCEVADFHPPCGDGGT